MQQFVAQIPQAQSPLSLAYELMQTQELKEREVSADLLSMCCNFV